MGDGSVHLDEFLCVFVLFLIQRELFDISSEIPSIHRFTFPGVQHFLQPIKAPSRTLARCRFAPAATDIQETTVHQDISAFLANIALGRE